MSRHRKELLESGHALTAQDTVRLMQQTYRAFVHDNAPRFAELFGHLLESDAPLVFHCTAGKDRTGFAAALILLALGVPRYLAQALGVGPREQQRLAALYLQGWQGNGPDLPPGLTVVGASDGA